MPELPREPKPADVPMQLLVVLGLAVKRQYTAVGSMVDS